MSRPGDAGLFGVQRRRTPHHQRTEETRAMMAADFRREHHLIMLGSPRRYETTGQRKTREHMDMLDRMEKGVTAKHGRPELNMTRDEKREVRDWQGRANRGDSWQRQRHVESLLGLRTASRGSMAHNKNIRENRRTRTRNSFWGY